MFTRSIMYRLSRRFSEEEVNFILDQIEAVLVDYTIKEKTTALAMRNNGDIVTDFLKAKKLEGLSDNSIRVYFSKYKQFNEFVHKSFLDVTRDDIRDYLSSLTTSRCTICNTKDILVSLYKWLVAEGYMNQNPAQGLTVNFEKNKRRPLTAKEMDDVRYACRNDVRRAALIEFLYSTGCRAGEVVRVKINEVDFEHHKVKVFGKGGKTRFVPLSDNAENALDRYINEYNPSEYLFYRKGHREKPLTVSGIESIVANVGKAAHLNEKLLPHMFRHSIATHLLQKGAPLTDIQCMLGHARPDTTQIYAETDPTQVIDDVRRLIR